MNVFNNNIVLLSEKIGDINLNSHNKKLYDYYRRIDKDNEMLFYKSFPKTIISESFKLGLARQSGYKYAIKKRNIIDVVTRKDKWVLYDSTSGDAYTVTGKDLQNDEDIQKIILDRVNSVDEKKNIKMIEEKSKRKPIEPKTKLSQVINKINFLKDYHTDITDQGISVINLNDGRIIMKREDAVNVLGLNPTPISEPIIEEIDDQDDGDDIDIDDQDANKQSTDIMQISD